MPDRGGEGGLPVERLVEDLRAEASGLNDIDWKEVSDRFASYADRLEALSGGLPVASSEAELRERLHDLWAGKRRADSELPESYHQAVDESIDAMLEMVREFDTARGPVEGESYGRWILSACGECNFAEIPEDAPTGNGHAATCRPRERIEAEFEVMPVFEHEAALTEALQLTREEAEGLLNAAPIRKTTVAKLEAFLDREDTDA